MMPLDQTAKQKRFLLASFPPHCPFCMPGGPESMVEVIADNADRIHVRADRRGGPHGGAGRRRRLLPPHQRESVAALAPEARWRPPTPAASPGAPGCAPRRSRASAPRNTTPPRLPTAQEAAVLYSAQPRRRRRSALLRAEIKDAAGRNNKQAWLMLFDLYQVAPNRAGVRRAVDALHGEVRAVAAGVDRRAASRQRPAALAEPRAQGLLRVQARRRRRARRRDRQVPSRSPKPRARCASTWPRSPRSAPGEAPLLAARAARSCASATCRCGSTTSTRSRRCCARRSTRSATRDQSALLAAALRAADPAGQDEEFEELGLEYAVAFEMSPPNWEVYVNTVAAAAAKSRGAAKPRGGARRPRPASS